MCHSHRRIPLRIPPVVITGDKLGEKSQRNQFTLCTFSTSVSSVNIPTNMLRPSFLHEWQLLNFHSFVHCNTKSCNTFTFLPKTQTKNNARREKDLTIWKTSEPSSKSTIAKKILLVNALEYLQEFARIWYSSSACLENTPSEMLVSWVCPQHGL